MHEDDKERMSYEISRANLSQKLREKPVFKTRCKLLTSDGFARCEISFEKDVIEDGELAMSAENVETKIRTSDALAQCQSDLETLRNQIGATTCPKDVHIRMFGRFTIAFHDEPIAITGKAKEILALLVANRGKEVSNEEINAPYGKTGRIATTR